MRADFVSRSGRKFSERNGICSRRWLEMFAKGEAGAKKAGADGVEGEFQQVRDFEIAELFEFAEEQDFTIGGVEPREGLAEPENFVVIFLGAADEMNVGIRTEEKGTKGGFAMVGAEDSESDGEEIGAKKSARLIARRGAKERDERFLQRVLPRGEDRKCGAGKRRRWVGDNGERVHRRRRNCRKRRRA